MPRYPKIPAINRFIPGNDRSLGIIACGLAYNYYMENAKRYGLDYPVLKIAQYPLPGKLVKQLAESTEEILVIEEGYPFVEEMLRGFFNSPYKVIGQARRSPAEGGRTESEHCGVSPGIE